MKIKNVCKMTKKVVCIACHAFVFIFLLSVQTVHASAALANNELFVNDSFTINGENFGPAGLDTSYVCFNDTTHCVRGSNFFEHEGWNWSDTSITAQTPTDIAVAGDVLVFVQIKKEECFPEKGYCEIKSVLDERGRAAYKIIPKIFSITPAPSGKKGETITLKGTGFGSEAGEVYLDSYLAVIKQWTYGSVDIETPPQFAGSTKKVTLKSFNSRTSQRDYRVASGISNDELSYQQEYLEQIFMREAWQIAGTQEVVVAVLDDGVLVNHPDLEANIWKNPNEISGNYIDDDFNGLIDDVNGYNFLDNNAALDTKGFHGTAVAGIIGAVRDNGVGIGGIVKSVKIMSLIVADAKGATNSTIVDRAIRYAADNGADVINLSFSTTGENGFFPQLDAPVQYAHDKGSVVVAAAGNGDVDTGVGINVNNRPQSPVCNTKRGTAALGVAALDNTDVQTEGRKLAKWSNYGSNCVAISAPGTRITTTVPAQFHKEGKLYALESGTSFATPIVAGVAALLKATYPAMRSDEVIDRIKTTADPINEYNTDYLDHIGGRVNAYRALAAGRPKPSLESFEPARLAAGERIFITVLNYDPTSHIVLTPTAGGADTVFPAVNSYTGTIDTFEFMAPSSLAPGTYTVRLISQFGEQINVHSQIMEILAPSPIASIAPPSPIAPIAPTPSEPSTQTLPDAVSPLSSPTPPLTPLPPVSSGALQTPQSNEQSKKPAELPKKFTALRGRILIQVEGKGEAWYVRPDTNRRVFMGRPQDAFSLMRMLGTGITTKNLEKIPKADGVSMSTPPARAFAKKHAGKIFLDIEKKGQAWYIHPKELKRYFLGRPKDAFEVMRKTGAGILNKDLNLIPIE